MENQVHWARNYLVWGGLLDGTVRGQWKLGDDGWNIDLIAQNLETAYELFKKVRLEHTDVWGQTAQDEAESEQPPAPVDEVEGEEVALANAVRSTVLGLSPGGFESLCKRLLTDLGLEQLRTVGQEETEASMSKGTFGLARSCRFAWACNASATTTRR